jgi:hypothetical protein
MVVPLAFVTSWLLEYMLLVNRLLYILLTYYDRECKLFSLNQKESWLLIADKVPEWPRFEHPADN